MIKRNTIQRKLVLEAVRKLRCHATADEIYAEVVRENSAVSKATVYRNLQQLCEAGEIRRRTIPGSADRYDHLCSNHYHVRCEQCGRVFDVDMSYMAGLERSIRNTHGFAFTGHDIVFRGICPQCRGKGTHDGTVDKTKKGDYNDEKHDDN